MYGKENQRRVAEKDLPLGRFAIFQTSPKLRMRNAQFRRILSRLGNRFPSAAGQGAAVPAAPEFLIPHS